ncbi:tyrosine-type recombinase/integrase [Stutzerimonas nitrititolerans]|uniref:tyrosine-type recombinase/integrase n=1 Tax=Stutzerimonas nitrititolerans TaxID=2482751 RepID=UPI0028B1F778|nr:tyrosine-type recombinase/integrase [Stutzerimonas nitrititolerans]
MANNLELQGSTYHVRLAIPVDVQHAFGGRRILSQSLMTGVHQEAMDRRLPILASWKAQIKIAREGKPLPEGWQDNLSSVLAELDAARRNRKLKIIGEPNEASTYDSSVVQNFKEENPAFYTLIESMVEKEAENGISGELRNLDIIHKVARNILEQSLKENYRATGSEKITLDEIFTNPHAYKIKSPISKSRLATFRIYRESRKVALKTIDQQESKLVKLAGFLNQAGKPLDFDAVSAWLDSMNLSRKTLAQYLLAGSVFWKWAMKHDSRWRVDFKDKANPFLNHDLPKLRGKELAESQRKAYSISELSSIYTAAVNSGRDRLADLILLGTYTGARIEELCELEKDSIVVVDGIRSFDIDYSKTKAGIRIVPIHPALADIVKRLEENSKDGYLIETNSRNKYKTRSAAMVKAFSRFKTKLGFGAEHCFHSIRATAITQMLRAGVQGVIIAEIVGHETGLVTFDVYAKGASSAQKLDAVTKIPVLTSITKAHEA